MTTRCDRCKVIFAEEMIFRGYQVVLLYRTTEDATRGPGPLVGGAQTIARLCDDCRIDLIHWALATEDG